MQLFHVNILAVILSSILCMVIGSIWYSKSLFSRQWSEALGRKMEDFKPVYSIYAFVFLLFLLEAFIFGKISYYARITDVFGSVQLALLIWVGFVAALTGINFIFEKRSRKLYFITAGYHLANIIAISVIMGAWK